MVSRSDDSGLYPEGNKPLRLGGFKILKGLFGVSIHCASNEVRYSIPLLQRISERQINLSYLSLINHIGSHNFYLMSEDSHICEMSHGYCAKACLSELSNNLTVLSLFPHRNDIGVLIRLLETVEKQGSNIYALASSSSALSVVLDRRNLERLTYALFGPFTFSSYRTPSDWKLAQKGKEKLFKEVVASYQEKRPKIYGLECWKRTILLQVDMDKNSFVVLRKLASVLAYKGAKLVFINSLPGLPRKNQIISFCCKGLSKISLSKVLQGIAEQVKAVTVQHVAILNMTGPHFGDRYGLALRLLNSLVKHKVTPLSFGCSVASMGLVVEEAQVKRAISSVCAEFDTPCVIDK